MNRATSHLDLAYATVAELASLLETGRVSSVELTRLSLDRLDRVGQALHCVAWLLTERAVEEARLADARRRIDPGTTGHSRLLGIPYGAKDLFAARGGPTRYGSAAFHDQEFAFDAAVVERLARVGSVLTAKLTMMELAGYHGTIPAASVDGATRNPWDSSRWAGGSSGGSAAAVAAGLVPYALASETGASIGWPSAYCGVTGIRPTYGLVSRHGAMIEAWSLDRLGAMARSAEDLALILGALAGRDYRDPVSAGRTFSGKRIARVRTDLMIGYANIDFGSSADGAVRSALADGLQALRDAGMRLVERELPAGLDYRQTLAMIIAAEGASAFEELISSDRLGLVTDARQRDNMRKSSRLSALDYLGAMRQRERVREAFRAIFRDVDLLVSFTHPTAATPIDEELSTTGPDVGNGPLTAAANLAGLPAVFLPCGLSDDGLPVGIQLVGPAFSEATLLAAGRAFQSVSGWHRLRPPRWS
ncbi:MAG: amidase [Chloroflexi bacterium]|nr:amidase [Chloroflexota bacterium]